MLNLNLNFRNRILLGVYIIYFARKLKDPFVTESFIFAVLALVLIYTVSIPSVLSNMMGSKDFYHYFITAFSNADIAVQSALVLAGITAILFVRNFTVHAILKTRLA